MVTCAHLACRASAGHATWRERNLWHALTSLLVNVHGVCNGDVLVRDYLVRDGDDADLAVRVVPLAAVVSARNAPTGRR